MLIPKALGLALFAFAIFILPFSSQANEKGGTHLFKGLSEIFFDPPLNKPYIMPSRPHYTNSPKILRDAPVKSITVKDKDITACIETLPHDHHSLMQKAASAARVMANHSAEALETLSFQPFFAGLKGPKITLMRSDLERTLVYHQGSAQEIYHNATLSAPVPCSSQTSHAWDVLLHHHIDAWGSDEKPLYRSDLIINNRVTFARHFMGTLGIRLPLTDNLEDDKDLRLLTSPRPVRQDVLGFAWQGLSLNRLMLSGMTTLSDDIHLAGHAGYLEEMFFGMGGEVLYRPLHSPFSIGAEMWGTTKRASYIGGPFALDKGNNQTSALINAWYDIPARPMALGLSYGRFLDGDVGGQARAVYRPAPGWKLEAQATLSNQEDRTLNSDTTNLFTGLRLTLPLGNLSFLSDNSRQVFDLHPFARDKGQRIDKAYPLYDLTDAWQADKIYGDWGALTE